MNKYKMIAMCSFSIVCVLILSLILPLTIDANDRESLEIKMHYKNSTVTTDIIVNSDIYTGVICKYIELDDVLTEEDLPSKTQTEGATVNLNQTSKDNYQAKIENVSKRYVVIYVSIGNCELCDYIDCNPSAKNENNNTEADQTKKNSQDAVSDDDTTRANPGSEEKGENNEENQESSRNIPSNSNVTGIESSSENEGDANPGTDNLGLDIPGANNSEADNTANNNPIVENVQNNGTQSNDFQTIEEVQNNNTNTQNSNETQSSNNNRTSGNTDTQTQNNTNQNTQTTNTESQVVENQNTQPTNSVEQNNVAANNSQNDFIPEAAGGSEPITDNNPSVQDVTPAQNYETVGGSTQTNNTNPINTQTNNIPQSNTNVGNQNAQVSGNRISLDSDEFQEIQSVEKTATANTGMPQTGENDSIKMIGVVVFSIVSVVSFYKYKKEK